MQINYDWLAGFIEGDGCFSCGTRAGKRTSKKIEIHQKNLEPLEKIKEEFGMGLYLGRLGVCCSYGKKAQVIFDEISPLLSNKRLQQAKGWGFDYHGGKKSHNLAWFAGYYEAEGCLYNKTNGVTNKIYAAMSISQYYADQTSQFCLSAVGHGRVAGPYMANGEKRAYSFNLSGTDAIKTIESIKPMLSQEKIVQLERVKQNAML